VCFVVGTPTPARSSAALGEVWFLFLKYPMTGNRRRLDSRLVWFLYLKFNRCPRFYGKGVNDGSKGYEDADAKQFVSWGVKYLKHGELLASLVSLLRPPQLLTSMAAAQTPAGKPPPLTRR
jgi:hypothetical protein